MKRKLFLRRTVIRSLLPRRPFKTASHLITRTELISLRKRLLLRFRVLLSLYSLQASRISAVVPLLISRILSAEWAGIRINSKHFSEHFRTFMMLFRYRRALLRSRLWIFSTQTASLATRIIREPSEN